MYKYRWYKVATQNLYQQQHMYGVKEALCFRVTRIMNRIQPIAWFFICQVKLVELSFSASVVQLKCFVRLLKISWNAHLIFITITRKTLLAFCTCSISIIKSWTMSQLCTSKQTEFRLDSLLRSLKRTASI